ncbi:MAG: tRNA pseudouridine(54/55) synthase Pus10 [Methanothrix sp.]|uniref:tRNA pseudouridine(54/55) synthase Pus10 n=1 Tax=Methanothrix sp. TaxID=90426 RepID=UPI0025CFBA77|nr:tRNA pseudouridine(54/55) synthase Pus10 [Methanothrix sp.]MCQ8902628.1 tRNA pseudouridine(54/55) synthase Pus10 [Methanothrix sp.]
MPSENQNDNCIASEIIQTALRILRLGPICDSCFGRQFAMLGTGMTNSERGRSIKTFMVMSADLRDPEESGEMLRALAPSCRQARLRLGLEDLAEPCWVCLGQMYPERLEELADRAVEALSGIECSRFLVGTFMSGLLAENEELLLADGCSRYAEPMKSEINREVGKLIALKSGKQPDLNNPEVVVHLHLSDGHIEIQIQPLYIYGRYRKLQRGFPQTRWPCRVCGGRGCERCGNTGRMYQESVDELIRGPIVEAADAEDTVFHGAGREDIDARMLGSGRPFVVEVVRPRRRDLDLNALRDRINKECSGKVEVSDLIFVDKSMVETVKNERFEKTYEAVVELSAPVEKEKLKSALSKLVGFVEQRTPTRVSHRRADKVRRRAVHSAGLDELNGRMAKITVRCDSGLYVKELISGDGGRTRPSLAELLGSDARVVELDVIDVGGVSDAQVTRIS